VCTCQYMCTCQYTYMYRWQCISSDTFVCCGSYVLMCMCIMCLCICMYVCLWDLESRLKRGMSCACAYVRMLCIICQSVLMWMCSMCLCKCMCHVYGYAVHDCVRMLCTMCTDVCALMYACECACMCLRVLVCELVCAYVR